MPPEQFDPIGFGGIGTPADIWALGCCMIEMLDGNPPWSRMNQARFSRAASAALLLTTYHLPLTTYHILPSPRRH